MATVELNTKPELVIEANAMAIIDRMYKKGQESTRNGIVQAAFDYKIQRIQVAEAQS